jgi:hypothetical protein
MNTVQPGFSFKPCRGNIGVNNLKDLPGPPVTNPESERQFMNTMIKGNIGIRFGAEPSAPLGVYPDFGTRRPRTLGQTIAAAVAEIADGSLHPVSPDDVPPFAQARAVLAGLVNCYARQIYSATEAASLVAGDPDFAWPWWAELPDARVFRRFRGENCEAVHRCLVAALSFLVEEKILAGALNKVNRLQLAEEARRRLVMAAFTDSLEFDQGMRG